MDVCLVCDQLSAPLRRQMKLFPRSVCADCLGSQIWRRCMVPPQRATKTYNSSPQRTSCRHLRGRRRRMLRRSLPSLCLSVSVSVTVSVADMLQVQKQCGMVGSLLYLRMFGQKDCSMRHMLNDCLGPSAYLLNECII